MSNADNDQLFYNRADALIHLANEQLSDMDKNRVSASFLFAAARFQAWLVATNFSDSQSMAQAKDQALSFFHEQFKDMLNENLDDYIKNFQQYLQKPAEDQ